MPTGVLQRKCACGGTTGPSGECEVCRKKKLQRKILNSKPAARNQSAVPLIVDEVLRSPGQPLDTATRAFMEPRFNHDFSRVRVHTDAQAADSARAVNALAYTVGESVVFGRELYAPRTNEGQKLIAHELTHVAQQSKGATHPISLTVGSSEDSLEAEANSMARQIVSGDGASTADVTSSGIHLRRACGPAEIGSQMGCVGRGGDVTDFGGDSEKIFRFRTGCDDYLPGEEVHVANFASTLSPDDQLEIDGFASEEGAANLNEELSCARAKALVSALIYAGVSSSQFVGIYMHGATSGSRPDRRSAVISIRWASESSTQEDCSDLIGSCDFYLCRERRHPCGEKGYYKGYGYKYCERFTRLESRLSASGKDWLPKTRRCLQQHIDRNIPADTPCPRVKQSAFDSHPDCYVLHGVCFLDPKEWYEIWNVIDPEDNDLKQVLLTGVYCIGNLGPVALFPQLSLGAGGGFRGLMERDRQRTRRLLEPPLLGR